MGLVRLAVYKCNFFLKTIQVRKYPSFLKMTGKENEKIIFGDEDQVFLGLSQQHEFPPCRIFCTQNS